jgi:hypothetical protein
MTQFKKASELKKDEKLVGSATEIHLSVWSVEESTIPGMVAVQTEFGALHLGAEEMVEIFIPSHVWRNV